MYIKTSFNNAFKKKTIDFKFSMVYLKYFVILT